MRPIGRIGPIGPIRMVGPIVPGTPMPAEKAVGLVVRTTDWSETSRIATIWTRELGKVRVLAKGGRRLKSRCQFWRPVNK